MKIHTTRTRFKKMRRDGRLEHATAVVYSWPDLKKKICGVEGTKNPLTNRSDFVEYET